MSDVTRILSQIESGDSGAADQLLPLVYEELRRLATIKLVQEKPGQTLQATALVHEAYLRLVGGDRCVKWNSRGHFFGAAAEAMRRILVEKARQKLGPKRGGGNQRVELPDVAEIGGHCSAEILQVHEVLDRLEADYPVQAELVKLRYFAGLSHQEAADALGLSRSTADRYWKFARAYLFAELEDQDK